jgi:hypothetical protein
MVCEEEINNPLFFWFLDRVSLFFYIPREPISAYFERQSKVEPKLKKIKKFVEGKALKN